MLKYQDINLPTGNTENIANALSGLGERKRKIHELWFYYGGTDSDNAPYDKFRAYIEQLRVMDVDARNFLYPFASADFEPTDMPIRIKVDIDLEIGQGFQVSVYHTGGTSNSWNCTMVYEDL